jgi:hypothetical protein
VVSIGRVEELTKSRKNRLFRLESNLGRNIWLYIGSIYIILSVSLGVLIIPTSILVF